MISSSSPIPLGFCRCKRQQDGQRWYRARVVTGLASDGHRVRPVVGRQQGFDEAPLPGVQGGLVHQRPTGTPSEPPGEATEPFHERQPAAWEGDRYLQAGSARRPWGELAWGKAPVPSVIPSRRS